VSEADRKAEELQKSSEQMKPLTATPAAGTMAKPAMAAPVSDAERKAQEARQKSEMMKPQ
jgi:hypothetical protein